MGKPNRDILTGGKRYAQKKARTNRVEEVTFDKDARHEFLTGFHKRKLMRKKKAQEFHAEQEKLARLEERKNIREERKDMIQKRLAEIEAAKTKLSFLSSEDEESDEEEEDSSVTDTEVNHKARAVEEEEEEEEEEGDDGEWAGFKDDNEDIDSQEAKNNKKHGILKVKQVYNIKDSEAPVSGESVVTIESMDNPNSSYIQNIDLMTIAKANHVDLNKSEEILEKSIERAKKYARLVGVDQEKPVKQKKKKFRYLSKTERKMKNLKEKEKKYKSRKRD